jgi:DNA repair protein RecN (Recombination protein N)
MLVELAVTGLGVIDAAELELDRGCSVLTGETGAGKTLLVAGLDLLCGGKADRSLVRAGAPEARVEGRFSLPPGHPARDPLAEHGLFDAPPVPGSDAEVVVTRAVARDGRSKARVNGRIVSLGTLSAIGGKLVEIAGQRAHGGVASTTVQRALLDAYAGPSCVRLAADVAAAVATASRAARESQRLAAEGRAKDLELDALAREITEIEAADVSVGESAALRERAARLEQAEATGAATSSALEALRGERGAGELLDAAAGELERLAEIDPALGAASERLQAASRELDDVALELAERAVPPAPEELEAVRSRLAQLQRLHRRYGGDSEVLARLEEARARRAALQAAADQEALLEAQRSEALRRAREHAAQLSEVRAERASGLAEELEHMLDGLALPEARVEVRLEPRGLYEGGNETVSFLVATDPGEAPKPVAKVASGGELSRMALALHLLTARGRGRKAGHALVFDEVDAGVGGEAARAVGRYLARLARATGEQVLVVTHLPQVAAFADAHYRVTKESANGRAVARVARVEGEDRVAELSRMLAGLPASERARSHARELLELAAAP